VLNAFSTYNSFSLQWVCGDVTRHNRGAAVHKCSFLLAGRRGNACLALAVLPKSSKALLSARGESPRYSIPSLPPGVASPSDI
jgi:hypothetical protein